MFDGGAPALKRQTIVGRKRRREGRREDAVRTAGKLLAVQMKRRDEEESEKRRRENERSSGGGGTWQDVDEDVVREGQDLVYASELGMSAQERQKSRKFFKKDAYHLPELQNGIEGMGQPNDPRIMSAEELAGYAQQFNNGEEVNMYDFSKIDFDGEFFKSLPAADRYNILNAARLRSRLRMGLSHDQLKKMFPNQMDFSRFQIERVRERNDLTRRVMNLTGFTDDMGSGRIAGDRSREYVLVKNDGVEGGWALGVVSTDKTVGERSKPIDIDAISKNVIESENSDEDEEFEDVPISVPNQLHRLPKLKRPLNPDKGVWEDDSGFEDRSRAGGASNRNIDSLFVDEEADGGSSSRNELIFDDEEEELNRAIAMSMQKEPSPQVDLLPGETEEEAHIRKAIALSLGQNRQGSASEEDEEFEDVPLPEYQQKAVEAPKPITTTNGKMVAHIVNNRANASVPKRKPATAFVMDSDSDSDVDMKATLARAKKQKTAKSKPSAPVPAPQNNPFGGLLPFESIPFKSLFKKTAPESGVPTTIGESDADDDMEGGFTSGLEEEKAKPLPPWLLGNGDIREEFSEQQKKDQELDAEDREQALEEERLYRKNRAPITIESDEEDADDSDVEIVDAPSPKKSREPIEVLSRSPSPKVSIVEKPIGEDMVQDDVVAEQESPTDVLAMTKTMAEVAEDVRADPPVTDIPQNRQISEQPASEKAEDANEEVDWSESDYGEDVTKPKQKVDATHPAGGVTDRVVSKSPSPVFEDVEMPEPPNTTDNDFPANSTASRSHSPVFADGDPVGQYPHNDQEGIMNDFDDFSDPEDEELLAQLAIEAEEHARFASTLNNKSEQENHAAYEAELKALRNQQKKDRRDADEVSHIMITECQALLRLFGLPYVTAPMEAEAQCAELVNLGLVDGVVTDDCDIFLFGGTRVYKNMFNSNKFVECYLSSDIEKELSITRDQLIGLAHLLGSDYTEGLPGIGPVTALEILSEFPNANTGLEEFREWWTATQLNGQKPNQETTTFRKKFKRAQATKLFLPASFPSSAVTEAYLKPDVDSNPEQFQWGVPDLDQLREFLMATIGWSQERTDEVLVPVIRDMNQREREGTQANITRFFSGGVGAGANLGEGAERNIEKGSKRMKDAVTKLKAKKTSGNGEGNGAGSGLSTFKDKAVEWAEREKKRIERERRKDGKSKKGSKRAATVDVDDEEDVDDGDEAVGV